MRNEKLMNLDSDITCFLINDLFLRIWVVQRKWEDDAQLLRMTSVLKDENLVERYTDDPVSGGIRVRVNGQWRSIEKEVRYFNLSTASSMHATG